MSAPAVARGEALDALAALAARVRERWPADVDNLGQLDCLIEEVGEAVQAWRRYTGRARRAGTLEQFTAELADVVIVAAVTALLDGQPPVRGHRPTFEVYPGDDPWAVAAVLRTLALHAAEVATAPTAGERDLAGVMGFAYAAAHLAGVDLNAAVDAKLAAIEARGGV